MHLLKARRHVLPIDHLRERPDPIAFDVLILQVVGLLPHVEDQQRHRTVSDVALVVVDLLHDQALTDRFPRHRPPTGALNVERRFRDLAIQSNIGTSRWKGCRSCDGASSAVQGTGTGSVRLLSFGLRCDVSRT